jgi:hypothetical protein
MDDADFQAMFLEYADSWARIESKADGLIATTTPS